MEKHILDSIVETVEGYPVKDLAWLKQDNVIRGRVKCPVQGRENLHEGYVVCVWRKNGTVIPRYGGKDRDYLNLKIIE
jgi:hypothetical protein